MFWLFFALVVLLLSFWGDETYNKNKDLRTIARAFLVFVLSYVIALCSNGTDRAEYIWLYENNLNFYNMEFGFVFLGKLCHWVGLSSVGFLFVISLLTNSLTVSAFYRFRFPVFVFFLYILSNFYMQEANLYRQMLSVSIGLFSIRYVEEKNIIKFLICVLIAYTIHQSSLILLVLTPFVFLQEEKYKTVKIILTALWIVSFGFYFNIFPQFDFLSVYFIDTRYESYASLESGLGDGEFSLDLLYNIFIALSLLFATKPKHQVIMVIFVLGGALSNASFGAEFFSRISLYFTPYYCAYIPTLLTENKVTEKNKFLGTALQVIIFLYYVRILFIHRVLVPNYYIGSDLGNILDIF